MLRAVLLGLLLTGCAYSQVGDSYYRVGVPLGFGFFKPEPSRPAPELASDRRVSEVDCSRPVDETLGNLRCR